jgi:hypothetical protein
MSSLVNSLKRQNTLLQEENERHANGLDSLANMLNEALSVLDGHDANYVAGVRARLGIAQPVSAAISEPVSDGFTAEPVAHPPIP